MQVLKNHLRVIETKPSSWKVTFFHFLSNFLIKVATFISSKRSKLLLLLKTTEERRNLYEEMGCFDPNTPAEVTVESSFSQAEPPPPQQQPPQILVAGSTSNSNCSVDVEELSEFHLSPQDCPQASSTPLQFQINPNPPACDQFHNNLIHHQMAVNQQQQQQHSNWDNGYQDFVNLGPNSATTTDLLSLLHLPRCSLPPPPHPSSMLPNSSISFSDIMSSSSAAAVMYDPLFHLNFPMQPRDQNQLRNGSCLLGVEDQIQMDANGGVNMMYFEGGNIKNNNNNNGGFDNGILEFNSGVTRKARGSRKSRTFPTERERRVHFNDRFIDLKNLIPNPTKVYTLL